MAHFKSIKSLEDLKNQFKALARVNHPDAGGNAEAMKEINCEYDQLFPVWQHRQNVDEPQTKEAETAYSTRSEFYTQNGWMGENYDSNQTLKEIAAIIRAYVKEVYPTYKFSVRTSYASMCQELHVKLKEAPKPIYKEFLDLTDKDIDDVTYKLIKNQHLDTTNGWRKADVEKQYSACGDFYKVYIDDVAEMLKDINRQVNSYNYDDSDSMIDYFHVKFYYFDCTPGDLKIVPKTVSVTKQQEFITPATTVVASGEYEINEDVRNGCCKNGRQILFKTRGRVRIPAYIQDIKITCSF